MKKSLSSLVLAGALLLGAVAPVTANAASAGTGTTNATAEFTKPATTTTPVDPTDPTDPVTDPDGSGDHGGATVGGDLTFLYISPSMDFGSHVAETVAAKKDLQSYHPASITSQKFNGTEANKNLVSEVSDTRGTNAGWQVSVSASPLTAGSNAIKNATIDLNGDTAQKTNSAGDTITGANVSLNTTTGASQVLYTAAENTGAGATAMQLAPSDITLGTLPLNIKAGNYTSTLTWTLGDTPEG